MVSWLTDTETDELDGLSRLQNTHTIEAYAYHHTGKKCLKNSNKEWE